MVNKLSEFYHSTEGIVEFGHDGITASNIAFSKVSMLSIEDPNYDILGAINTYLSNTRITWEARQVEGHQDDKKDIKTLDQWAHLNIEMNSLAKQHIAIAKT